MKRYLTHIGPVVNPFSARVRITIHGIEIVLKEVFFFTKNDDSEVYILRSADSDFLEKGVSYSAEELHIHKNLTALSDPIEIGEGSLWIDEDKNLYYKNSVDSVFQKFPMTSP